MVKKSLRIITLVLGVSLLLGIKSSGVSAASIDVVAGVDSVATNGQCSLSEAFINVNNQDNGQSDCASGAGDAVINLPSGTITLQGTPPQLHRPVSIIGEGRGLSIIDGNGAAATAVPVQFDVASANLEIRDFGVKNTSFACVSLEPIGSVHSSYDVTASLSNLDLTDCGIISLSTIQDNGSGFKVNLSSVNVSHSGAPSTINLGVMLSNLNEVHVDGMSVSNNMIGMLLNNSKIETANYTIQNTTLNSNNLAIGVATANSSGNEGWGNLNLVLRNNTIVGNGTPNSDDGGSELSSIGSQIYAGGLQLYAGEVGVMTVTLQNNIIANNRISTDNHLMNCSSEPSGASPTVTSLGNNLSDDDCAGTLGSSDQKNVSGASSNLGPLQNNGGAVLTMALQNGSSAIDGGATIGAVTTDARGVGRPKGVAYDIGAYELGENSGGGNNDGGNNPPPGPPRTGVVAILSLVTIVLIAGGSALVVRKFRYERTSSKSEH